MTSPTLTFFVELDEQPLSRLFDDGRVERVLAEGCFGLSMGLLDLTEARAKIVRRLEDRGIPVTAWLLLGEADGYWLNADNSELATARYREVRAWARAHGLRLPWVGLDIEFPRAHTELLTRSPARGFLLMLWRRRTREAIFRAEAAYARLVEEIRGDGRRVESYLFPQVLDERRAGTTLLRRALGLIDVRVDREVYMLYTTHIGANAARAYMPEAMAIAVGSTGGGVDGHLPETQPRLIGGESLASDLRAAARHTRNVYAFSLEGCVERGDLDRLKSLDWEAPPRTIPEREFRSAMRARRRLQALLRTEPVIDALRLRGRPQ